MNILIENALDEDLQEDCLEIIENAIKTSVAVMNFDHDYEVSVTLVSKEEIRQINHEYRNKSEVTDVLSFPLIDYEKPGDFSHIHHMGLHYNHDSACVLLGDIVICYEKALTQAQEYGHSSKREIAFLTVHSMLHLFGFDHINEVEEEQMIEMQKRILTEMGLER